MCCFIVPMAEAIATTAIRKFSPKGSNPFINKLGNLEKMLWGGTVMLIADHVINGEVIFRFPFFTALTEVGGAQVMLSEMLHVGVPMALVLTGIWAVQTMLSTAKSKREQAAL